jgi:hypothetical protein
VLTSRNVRGGVLVDLVLGGPSYQIEHHLFPNMPRANPGPGHPCSTGTRANPAWVEAHRMFHHRILDGTGVTRLSDIARGLRDCSELYQFWSYARGRTRNGDIVAEHREIAERTLARDEDGAATALTQYVERTPDLQIAYLNGEGSHAKTGTARSTVARHTGRHCRRGGHERLSGADLAAARSVRAVCAAVRARAGRLP